MQQAAQSFVDLVRRGQLDLPMPGSGGTLTRFDAFVRLGRQDPVLARLGEGHADALAILTELGADAPAPGTVWGVWAAVPTSVKATRDGDRWRLSGDRPWCSGAGTCTHALVVAEADDGPRLFAVAIDAGQAEPLPDTWPAVGMARSDSRTVRFTDAVGLPVGAANDYVDRPGFWHGAVGVAACWYGGALGIADALRGAAGRRDLDPHALAHLGACDAALAGAAATLREAAAHIDARPKEQNARLARQTRAVRRIVRGRGHRPGRPGPRRRTALPRCRPRRPGGRPHRLPETEPRRTGPGGARPARAHRRRPMVKEIVGAGTPETTWRPWADLQPWPSLPEPPPGRVTIVAPHPDDEILGLGGLSAQCRPARLVAVTDGEASHPESTVFSQAQLAAIRREETSQALKRLGLPDIDVVHLGQPDGRIDEPDLVGRLSVAAGGGRLVLRDLARRRPPRPRGGRSSRGGGVRRRGRPSLGVPGLDVALGFAGPGAAATV